ncbi:MAG: hypothetical protein JNL60_00160, partial [Bacteroidia bacterium]|nr:hypothetical protein [Bacteroidia bacterium]
MKTLITIVSLSLTIGLSAQSAAGAKTKPAVADAIGNSKFEQDKAAIKSMCGIYKVSFDFAETFSSDTAYKFHNRYKEHGIEYVFLAEESLNKMV